MPVSRTYPNQPGNPEYTKVNAGSTPGVSGFDIWGKF